MKSRTTAEEIIKALIPKGASVRVLREDTGIGNTHILRVITTAWKRLPRYQRVVKVREAINEALPRSELNKILRVSVLTAAEFNRLAGIPGPARVIKVPGQPDRIKVDRRPTLPVRRRAAVGTKAQRSSAAR